MFGKPRIKRFRDARIGELTTQVRGHHDRSWCDWRGQHMIAGQQRATRFSLSGDSNAPDAGLLRAVHAVLDDLDGLAAKAKVELAKARSTSRFEDFHLALISDWDHHDEILSLEFEPMRGPTLDRDLQFQWPGDDGLGHQIRFNAKATSSEQRHQDD